jgi:hypothetical protein
MNILSNSSFSLVTVFSLLHRTLCVHLLWRRFDVDVPGNMVYKESRFTSAGNYICKKISVFLQRLMLFLIHINFSLLVQTSNHCYMIEFYT